jgi:lipopolysaccharide/colanic/teichoic acid biosynthesis glycosyltransferase
MSLLVVALNIRARNRNRINSVGTLVFLRGIKIYPIFKRVAETVMSIVLLILLAPLFLLLTLSIRWDSPGPALFRQTRIGKGGKPFTFYKFRTMFQDIDRSAHQTFLKAYVNGELASGTNGQNVYKPIQANQITRVGRLLRKTSLDELPQLFNIIKGEMSFIGPRPNIPAEVEAYKDWHRKRLEVLPGITGLAQINGRSTIAFDQIVRYDIEYVENAGLLMDLKVVWRTIPAALLGNGAK